MVREHIALGEDLRRCARNLENGSHVFITLPAKIWLLDTQSIDHLRGFGYVKTKRINNIIPEKVRTRIT